MYLVCRFDTKRLMSESDFIFLMVAFIFVNYEINVADHRTIICKGDISAFMLCFGINLQ